MGERNTNLSAYTKYRHLGKCCAHPSKLSMSSGTLCRPSILRPKLTTPLALLYFLTNRQILDSSNLKEFADDNFRFDENRRKFSKWVDNTEGNTRADT